MPRIVAVLTRDLDGGDLFGRITTLREVMSCTNSVDTNIFNVRSLVETKSIGRLLRSLLRHLILTPTSLSWPVQCILFDDAVAARELIELISAKAPTCIYFDSVRCLSFIERIAQVFPQIRLVCDFDDLMSRRARLTDELGEGLSLGYLRKHFPKFISTLLQSRLVAHLVNRHEANSLARTETRIAALVDTITLVSQVEVDQLISMAAKHKSKAEIVAVAPPFVARRRIRLEHSNIRFVFLGQDKLLQNRLSIKYLLDAWERHGIVHPLFIYGQQATKKDQERVFWPGYVHNLEEIYSPNSVLICPPVLAGGLKTKLLEALSYGVVPLGNQIAYEAITMPDNSLSMTNSQLIDTILHIEREADGLVQAAQRLQDYYVRFHSRDATSQMWRYIFTGSSIPS